MEGATHFIEQYKLTSGNMVQDKIAEIKSLSNHLYATSITGLKTIAVWKIKYKNQKNKTND